MRARAMVLFDVTYRAVVCCDHDHYRAVGRVVLVGNRLDSTGSGSNP